MKVKIFRFRVSNMSSVVCTGDKREAWYQQAQSELVSEKEIENTINNFTKTVQEVIDIKVSTVDVHYHNNARANTIDLIYTVIYKQTNTRREKNYENY